MSITQRELARELNLSPSTVSKAFRSAHDVGQATRSRVLAQAARLGYHVPQAGVGTLKREVSRQQESRFIGVFYRSMASRNSTHSENVLYMDGLSEAAEKMGVSLLVHQVTGDDNDLMQRAGQPTALREGLLSGVVLIHRFAEAVVRQLAESLPVVTITHWVPGAACDHVDSDHMGGVQRLVQHLTGLGHRKIGFVARSTSFGFELSRYASFCRAMAHEQLHVASDHAVINQVEPLDAKDAARKISLELENGVTAWMCSTEVYAYEVIAALQKLGINVPGQVSIVGFDDQHMAGNINLQHRVTTVETPFHAMGEAAFEQLFRRTETPTLPARQILLDCPLRVGDSTGRVS